MSDDLTAQVREAMWNEHSDLFKCYGPTPCVSEVLDFYAPQIAACMRVVARCGIDLDAIDDGIHTPFEVERIAEEQENACLAAGLAALRGET